MTGVKLLKEELVEICQSIYDNNLVEHGEGNISLRIPGKSEMAITPSGNDYTNLLAENMVHMTFDGRVIDEHLDPSSEHLLHRRIYLSRPKANCVIHTHSPYASALAVLQRDLPVIIEEMALFLGGGVKCTNFAPVGTEMLAKNALKSMSKQNAVLLANHGVVVVGRSSEYCIKAAVIIEKMAQIFIQAETIGKANIIYHENYNKFVQQFQEKFSTI
ncbi:MAG: class II aldolase/adducin family protein [Candidatus Heimdallarchaeota archaeon]